MQILAMTLTQHPNEASIPATVSVILTAEEVAYLGALVGKQPSIEADKIMPRGGEINRAIYDALVNEVANRFFDEGVDDMIRAVSE